MHGRPPGNVPRTLAARSIPRLRRLARHWRHVAHTAWVEATHPPELGGWLCIHRYEGSWADPNSPYWGGLQMDLSFQATYGGWLLRHKGTADHWSPLEQIWVAVRASRTRGFSPWPNTARYCGL
jgi:Transglycosylase-like domain